MSLEKPIFARTFAVLDLALQRASPYHSGRANLHFKTGICLLASRVLA